MPFSLTSAPMLLTAGDPGLAPVPFGGYPESDTPCCMLYRDPSELVPQPVQNATPRHNATTATDLVFDQMSI